MYQNITNKEQARNNMLQNSVRGGRIQNKMQKVRNGKVSLKENEKREIKST